MKVYIQSTILAGKRLAHVNIKIAKLNKKLRLLAEQSNLVTYIDLNIGLAKESLLDAVYTRDDLHLNGKGYAVWKRIISPYILQYKH